MEARNVGAVHHFQQQAEAGAPARLGGVAQVGDEQGLRPFRVGTGRRLADEAVELRAAEAPGIVHGACDTIAELGLAARQHRDAALAAGEVAGR